MSVNLIRRPPTTHEDGRLYAAIVRAGFSIKGFAQRTGVVRSTVWRIDRGLQCPPEEWWTRAADLLGTTVEDIAPEELMVVA